jgi:hypothetical protein
MNKMKHFTKKITFFLLALQILFSCSNNNDSNEKSLLTESIKEIPSIPSIPSIPDISEKCIDVNGVEGEPPVGYSGVSYTCFSNGRVWTKSIWKDNEKIEWADYYESGILYKRKSYVNNKKNGDDLEYFVNGTLARKQIYKNGGLLEEVLFTIRGEITEHWISGVYCYSCELGKHI